MYLISTYMYGINLYRRNVISDRRRLPPFRNVQLFFTMTPILEI